MVNYISQEVARDGLKSFDARDIMTRYTCDVTSSCVFATDAHSFSSQNPLILTTLRSMLRGIADSIQSIFPKKMIPKKHEDDFIKIMTDAVKYREQNKSDRDDFLAHIIATKQRKGQTDVEVAAHGWTYFLDAYDTSAVVAQQALYEIAKNIEVQEKLREEIMENIDESGKLSFDKISELPYLDQVFYEVLRLHPPFMFTTKVCSEDIELDSIQGQKFLMKKDSTVLVSIHSIHRDPGE